MPREERPSADVLVSGLLADAGGKDRLRDWNKNLVAV
jgi:hypothetical protein